MFDTHPHRRTLFNRANANATDAHNRRKRGGIAVRDGRLSSGRASRGGDDTSGRTRPLNAHQCGTDTFSPAPPQQLRRRGTVSAAVWSGGHHQL